MSFFDFFEIFMSKDENLNQKKRKKMKEYKDDELSFESNSSNCLNISESITATNLEEHISFLDKLNMNYQNIQKTGIAFVFESEKSVLQFESFGAWKNLAIASCGSNLNKFQVDLLIRTCGIREIVVCYDNEENRGEDKYFNKLYNI